MTTATVTSKGQVTIPAAIRSGADIKAGTRLSFVPQDKKTFLLIVDSDPLDELRGCIPYDGPAISTEHMRKAIDTELAAKWSAR